MTTFKTPNGEYTNDGTNVNDLELARRVRSLDLAAGARACEADLRWFALNSNKNYRLRAGFDGEGIGDMVLIKRLASGGFERVAAPIQTMSDREIIQFSKALNDEHWARMFDHFSGANQALLPGGDW